MCSLAHERRDQIADLETGGGGRAPRSGLADTKATRGNTKNRKFGPPSAGGKKEKRGLIKFATSSSP